jgi:hypothetical protein
MYAKLFLGLLAATLLIGDVSAQSGVRSSGSSTRVSGGSGRVSGNVARPAGSYSRGYNSAAAERQQERLEASEIQRFARKIEKNYFAPVRLETKQKRALKELVKNNYQDLAMIENKMKALIPEQSASELKRRYSTALRRGSTESEAMLVSMQAVGFPAALQEKIMVLSTESDSVTEGISTQFSNFLTADQRQALLSAKEEALQQEASGAEKEMTNAKPETSNGKESMTDTNEKMVDNKG